MRKWLLAGLAVTAVCLAGASYHLFVAQRSADHYRALVEAPTVEEKAFHYREVFRFYDPFDRSRLRARQWVVANGHEWGLGEDGRVEEGPVAETVLIPCSGEPPPPSRSPVARRGSSRPLERPQWNGPGR